MINTIGLYAERYATKIRGNPRKLIGEQFQTENLSIAQKMKTVFFFLSENKNIYFKKKSIQRC